MGLGWVNRLAMAAAYQANDQIRRLKMRNKRSLWRSPDQHRDKQQHSVARWSCTERSTAEIIIIPWRRIKQKGGGGGGMWLTTDTGKEWGQDDSDGGCK